MKKHLYNSTLGKVPWFIKRFGWSEMLFKPIRLVFAPAIIPFLPKHEFTFDGQHFRLFYHRYNMTWAGERCVEVPIALSYLQATPSDSVLEVGNVLSHYSTVRHVVVDKFEVAEGVLNVDIISYESARRYSLVLSISTFEHVGFDDDADGNSGDKILAAVAACRRLLTKDGRFVMTCPIGYNPDLDSLLRNEKLGTSRELYLRRRARLRWEQISKGNALECHFGSPFPYANAIVVAEFRPLQ